MDEVAYVVHHIPGRMRIRVPHAKGHPRLLGELRDLLQSLDSVREVETSTLTGSLLVHYAPEAFAAVRDFLGRAPGLSLAASEPAGTDAGATPRAAIMKLLGRMDESVRSATDGQLDLKLLLPLGAISAGLLMIRKSMSTPLWLTLMIFGFGSFVALNRPDAAGARPLPSEAESRVWH